MLRLTLLLCAGLIGLWAWQQRDPFQDALNIIVPNDPLQTPTQAKPFNYTGLGPWFPREVLITPLADYDITGRVLHTRRYWFHDYVGDIIPFDIGLGWKAMSDLSLIRPWMRFEHNGAFGGRYIKYMWRSGIDWNRAPPPSAALAALSDESLRSNNHIVPASGEVMTQLDSLKVGDIVRLKGQLIQLEHPGDETFPLWKSSLSRTDTATKWAGDNTNCETIYVTSVENMSRR